LLNPVTLERENPTSPAPSELAFETAMMPAHTLTTAVMTSILTATQRLMLKFASWILERGRILLAS
jgi:hypothetical protein